MATDNDFLTVDIWRGTETGRLVRYSVPKQTNQTVLDVVTWVQRNLAPDLAYRFACRVGMCGSCATTVNGIPRWTCRTRVETVAADGKLEIRPLRNLPLVKDLVTDMDGFFERWRDAGGPFQPPEEERQDLAAIRPDDTRRRTASAGIECIGCAVCYSACDTVTANPDFLGPAALNRAWSAAHDDRDANAAAHLGARDGGAHLCHSQGSCSRHCPLGLNPTRAITGLKRALLWRNP